VNVEVKLINEKGKPLPRDTRATREGYRGTLRVRQDRINVYGRFVTKAQLLRKGDATGIALLPDLLDAEVIWVEDGALRIRGTEMLDGVQFNQTWEAKVL
jgi:hypothetical protein